MISHIYLLLGWFAGSHRILHIVRRTYQSIVFIIVAVASRDIP